MPDFDWDTWHYQNIKCPSQKNNNLKMSLENRKKINEGVQINEKII